MTLAALEATLRLYLRAGDLAATLPTLRYLSRTVGELELIAERAREILAERLDGDFRLEVVPSLSQIGLGAQPTEEIPSRAVRVTLIPSLRPRESPRCSARPARRSSDESRTTPSCSTSERWTMRQRSRYRFQLRGHRLAGPLHRRGRGGYGLGKRVRRQRIGCKSEASNVRKLNASTKLEDSSTWAGGTDQSIHQGVRSALKKATQTLRNIDWFEVREIRGSVNAKGDPEFQVHIKIGFRLESGSV